MFRELLGLSILTLSAGGLCFDKTIPKDKALVQIRGLLVHLLFHWGSHCRHDAEIFSAHRALLRMRLYQFGLSVFSCNL